MAERRALVSFFGDVGAVFLRVLDFPFGPGAIIPLVVGADDLIPPGMLGIAFAIKVSD